MTQERRPAGNEAASVGAGHHDHLPVPRMPSGGGSEALAWASAPRRVREAVDAAYGNGYTAGLAAGRVEAEALEAARWSAMSRRIIELGTGPSAARLADARGQHDRAAAIRAEHARRGVTP